MAYCDKSQDKAACPQSHTDKELTQVTQSPLAHGGINTVVSTSFRIVDIIDFTHVVRFWKFLSNKTSSFCTKHTDKNNKTNYLCKSILRILTTRQYNDYVDSK